MNKTFKNIIVLTFTAFTLFVSMGINISKMQCDKGGKIFVGTEVPNCKAEQKVACNMEKKKCCKQQQKADKKPKEDCEKESLLLQIDLITQECKCSEVLDFSIVQPLITILFDFYQISASDLSYNTHYADAPPLVRKPILSQIQSFLL